MLVLVVALMVSTAGLAAMGTLASGREAAARRGDSGQATLNARAGLEMALFRLNEDASGRVAFTDGTWAGQHPLPGGGTYEFAMTDPLDGDLTDDLLDPVRIVATGRSGDATRQLTVTINYENSYGPDLIDNGGGETGSAVPWVVLAGSVSPSTTAHYGSHSVTADLSGISSNNIGQSVFGEVVSGREYRATAWVRPVGAVTIRCRLRHEVLVSGEAVAVTPLGPTVVCPPGTWTLISGSATPTWDTSGTVLSNFLVITSDTRDFDYLIDGVTLREVKIGPRLDAGGVTRIVD